MHSKLRLRHAQHCAATIALTAIIAGTPAEAAQLPARPFLTLDLAT